MSNTDMSFLPADYVERRIEQRTNVICLTLFGVVLIGVVAAFLVTSRHRGEVRRQVAEINTDYAEAARRIEQLEQLQKRRTQMLRKAEVTGQLVEPVPRTFLLADLINRMPPTLSLFELSLSTKADRAVVAPAGVRSKPAMRNLAGQKVDDKGNVIEDEPAAAKQIVSLYLVGVAPTDVQVAQYMSSLGRSDLLSDVNLVFSEESKVADTTMRKFRIEMSLADHADARKVEPLLADRRLKMNPLDNPAASRSVITPEGTKLGGPAAPLPHPVTAATPGQED